MVTRKEKNSKSPENPLGNRDSSDLPTTPANTGRLFSNDLEGSVEAVPASGESSRIETLDDRVEVMALQPAKVVSRIGKVKEQEFFLPVHGEVRLTPNEVEIVNHPAFQRLGEIYQLGQTHLLYRGATHKRFEHSLGALHVANMIINALNDKSDTYSPDNSDNGTWTMGERLRQEEIDFIRLGALLHDIGHLPAGHTLEDELGLLKSHDGIERLDLVLNKSTWHGLEIKPTLGDMIDKNYKNIAIKTKLFTKDGEALSASEILKQLICKFKLDSEDLYKPVFKGPAKFRLKVCQDIIGNTICADLLDYLHRDWLHIGKPRDFDKRLLGYMEIRTRENNGDSKLVINLRAGNKVRTDAVTAILDLLESRYQLGEIALFHRTKCCAAAMLERIIAEAAEADKRKGGNLLQELPEKIIEMSDDEMLNYFIKILESYAENDKPHGKQIHGAILLTRKLRLRRLYKEFVAYPEFKLADGALEVQDLYSGPHLVDDPIVRAQIAADNRYKAMKLMESDFNLSPCSLAMYCPPRKMNTKIAMVQILVHGDVHTLDAFEEDAGDRGVTGGHLRAQKERFRRLWRVIVSIDPGQRQELKQKHLLESLGRAISLCVLRIPPPTGTIDEAILALVRELTTMPGSPFPGKHVVDEIPRAARESSLLVYPGGAPSLTSCLHV